MDEDKNQWLRVEIIERKPEVWLWIVHQQGIRKLLKDEVLQVKADGNYAHFMLASGRKLTCARTLQECEEALEGHGFYRVDDSALVNLEKVLGYAKPLDRGQGGVAELADGTKLKVSRRRVKGFLEAWTAPSPKGG